MAYAEALLGVIAYFYVGGFLIGLACSDGELESMFGTGWIKLTALIWPAVFVYAGVAVIRDQGIDHGRRLGKLGKKWS